MLTPDGATQGTCPLSRVRLAKVKIKEALQLLRKGVVNDGIADSETLVNRRKFEADSERSEVGAYDENLVNTGGAWGRYQTMWIA